MMQELGLTSANIAKQRRELIFLRTQSIRYRQINHPKTIGFLKKFRPLVSELRSPRQKDTLRSQTYNILLFSRALNNGAH